MEFSLSVFGKTRGYFKSFLDKLTLDDLNKIPDGFKNNIIWNIGHVVVTEQLLLYRLSGLPTLVSEEVIEKYKVGTKPDKYVTQKEVDEISELLFTTINKTQEDYNNNKFVNYKEYTVSTTGDTLRNIDDAISFALFHEGMHFGYILALRKSL
ncbi:MAG: DinB family protein [Flavobacteriaceae bacterium]|nr:DinB family protein [Bacteroidia bacterium]NNL15676.1 DinB family protein [Flavobacteriaceae bacterium]